MQRVNALREIMKASGAAAFITPSGDPFTLMAVGLPLYALYELSIFVCRDINQ